jgi:hypothetical protein
MTHLTILDYGFVVLNFSFHRSRDTNCFADSHMMEVATKLVLLILSKLSLDVIINDYLFELSVIVSLYF